MAAPPDPIPLSYVPPVRITKLPVTSSIDEILEVLDRDGGLILTDMLSPEQLAKAEAEVEPHVPKAGTATNGFTIIPKETILINGLVGKSPTIAKLCEHPHLVGLSDRILRDHGERPEQDNTTLKYNVDPLLSLSLSFRVGYGAPRQRLHRDDLIHLWDHSPPYDIRRSSQFACLVAASETTQANGATMFVPGSHCWDNDRKPKLDEVTFAEMKPGSALIFLAGAYHGAGHNSVKGATRVLYGLFFCRGTLRTEENQFLAVSRSKVLAMSPHMQTLLGYKQPELLSLGMYEGGNPMDDLEGAFITAGA